MVYQCHSEKRLAITCGLGYNGAMSKTASNITVKMTLSWSFNEREWKEEEEHLKALRENPAIILGTDVIHSLFNLNEITAPNLEDLNVYVMW